MIEKVIDIVRESSRFMKERDFTVECKGTVSNNVTSADIAVQKYLKEKLLSLMDDCGFYGEESNQQDYQKENLWVVDPIDGTTNFIRDLGCSCISVALVKSGEPVLGVVYNPYRDEMFWAEKGRGAFLNGSPIHVSDRNLEHSLFCTAFSLYNKNLAKPCQNILEKMYGRCDDFRRFGSAAIELASLACGRVDLYFEIRLFPWDFAASEIIIREAGGYVGTVGMEKTVFNRPIPIIGANSRENYEYLRQTVLREIPEIPYRD